MTSSWPLVVVFLCERRDGNGSFNDRRKLTMANPPLSLPKKNTASTNGQTTIASTAVPSSTGASDSTKTAGLETKADTSSVPEMDPVKTGSEAIKTTTSADDASGVNKTEKSVGTETGTGTKEISSERTKMDVATEIYVEMKGMKGFNRKDVLDRFVLEAKLSKAGASTYFQLIKAKVG